MKLNWNFLGEGVKTKPFLGGVWIFSGTTQFAKICSQQTISVSKICSCNIGEPRICNINSHWQNFTLHCIQKE